MAKAKQTVSAEYQKQGFNLPEMLKRLNIKKRAKIRTKSNRSSEVRYAFIKVAVIGATGGTGRAKEPTRFFSEAIENIIAAMLATKAQRLICVGASGYIDEPRHPAWIRLMMKNLVQPILRHSYEDMMRMEEIIKTSELDWTIVRPPRLTNGRRTEFYRVQKEVVIGGAKISRADVADYIVEILNDSRSYRGAFGVAY